MMFDAASEVSGLKYKVPGKMQKFRGQKLAPKLIYAFRCFTQIKYT